MVEEHCTSCNSLIAPTDNYAKFFCPKCEDSVIIRCAKCKLLVNEYTCIKCGFTGP